MRQWYEDNYKNKKLQIRLQELIWSRGLTELELCKILEIPENAWDQLSRGVRRPSHALLNQLMEILGDEVQFLFIGYYMDDETPKITTADKFDSDSLASIMREKIKKVREKGGNFRYM